MAQPRREVGASDMFANIFKVGTNAAKSQRAANSSARTVKKAVKKIKRTAAPRRQQSSAPRRQQASTSKPRTAYRAPTPPRVSTPRPAVGNNRSGAIAASVPAPAVTAPISIDQYLAQDTAYGSQRAAYEKALKDYGTQMAGEQGKYNTEYDASLGKLQTEQDKGFDSLQDDYASRGMLTSGVYSNALNEFQNNFDTQRGDLSRAKEAYTGDLALGQTNFKEEQSQYLAKAKQDALNRRLASLGV